tara:strand:- start:526 stop:1554 length:1029 start_codon:yes stop_codon:yes gene_type:complete
MSLPSTVTGTAFSIATCTGGYMSFPFRDNGDTITKIYYHEMKVLTAAYAPLEDFNYMTANVGFPNQQKPIRSPFADDSNAYYVGDQSVSNGGDGFTTFIRVFANIPQTRYDPTGLYAFDFSGVTTTSSSTNTTTYPYTMSISSAGYNTPFSSPSYRFGSALGSGNIFVGSVSGDTTKLAVGDAFTVTVTPTISYDTATIGPRSISSFGVSIRSIAGTIITMRAGKFSFQDSYEAYYNTNPTSLGFSKTVVTSTSTTTDGEIETRNSPSRELKSYVMTSDPTSVTLSNMTQLPDSLSSSTTPTLAEYNAMVANGEYLNGAPETISRFLGNIYEKSLIQVRAIS